MFHDAGWRRCLSFGRVLSSAVSRLRCQGTEAALSREHGELGNETWWCCVVVLWSGFGCNNATQPAVRSAGEITCDAKFHAEPPGMELRKNHPRDP